MATKRKCTGKTKAGKPCQAAPLKGLDVCLAHADQETRESMGFGGPQEGAGRPRIPRVSELLIAQVEERAEEVAEVLWDALEATAGIVIRIGDGKDRLETGPDHKVRIAAARELLDRTAGKARQSIELTGDAGGPVRVTDEAFADPDVRKALHDLARRVGAARASESGGLGSSG